MKYSIVIPTYNNCEKYLKPCIDSIVRWTDMADVELVISANGCTDNTKPYLDYLKATIPNLKVVWHDEPLGYPKAVNVGVAVASAQKIILLNNDIVLLEQTKNQWLEILEKPFANEKCGISCIIKQRSDAANHDFAVFFCVMIDKQVFNTIGYLDESFGIGSGEDVDFCIRAEQAGFEVLEVFAKVHTGEFYTGGFPIYHIGEGTVHNESLVVNWDKTFYTNELKLAKKYNLEWYRWKLTNNYERAVFLKGDPVHPRESTRYLWANQNILDKNILEIGCSTGYGSQFLPNDTNYLGLDYDPIIIGVAKEQDWGSNRQFSFADINTYELGMYDTIIAFEVIEHLDNGLEIVEKLKKHCKRLLITVPHNEPKGFWGEHHRLHGLTEKDFHGFKYNYIDQHGRITETLTPVSENNICNLMIMRFDNV